MELLELIRRRRSIRRYQDRPVPREVLETILEAGSFAPNAGGGQRTLLYGIRDPQLLKRLGQLNAACMDRSNLAGSHVSREQPSLIDDVTIKSGFYGAPCVCVVFSQRNFLYGIPDAFCCAENMVLMAGELGVSSCIVARAEETFATELGAELRRRWQVPDHYEPRCFVLLGYCDGDYPMPKPRREGRIHISD